MATANSDNRVTAAEVNEILDSVLQDSDLNAFINAANNLVDNYLNNKGLASSQLTDIEKFLSAHFASMRDRRTASIKTEGTSYKWEGDTGIGLDHTGFGQTAKVLDTSGTLSKLDEKAKSGGGAKTASIRTLGKKPEDRYTDNVN